MTTLTVTEVRGRPLYRRPAVWAALAVLAAGGYWLVGEVRRVRDAAARLGDT